MKTILCLGLLAMMAGCDGSRVELESAKTNLANVTRERDDLKVQVATLQQQLTTSKADLAKAKAAEPPSGDKSTMAAKSSPAASSSAPSKKDKHAHKS